MPGTGKIWEVKLDSAGTGDWNVFIGVYLEGWYVDDWSVHEGGGWILELATGKKWYNAISWDYFDLSLSAGTVFGIAVSDDGKIWFGADGVWADSATPAFTNVKYTAYSFGENLFPVLSFANTLKTSSFTAKFNTPLTYSPPSGYTVVGEETWNPTDTQTQLTLSNGNLTVTSQPETEAYANTRCTGSFPIYDDR